jgi:acyl-CoA reductase-like NAD-dependent aldehyde dehydrogenase
VLVPGNSAVVVASGPNPLVASALGEVIATSDVPAGVVNILTTDVDDVLAHLAPHRDIDAVHAAGLTPAHASRLRAGVAENLKRVTIRDERTDFADARNCESVWWIEPFVEFKTIWHPSAS